MNVCVTVNSKYQKYLYIMLLSLYENNSERINLYVINRDFNEFDKKMIRDLTEKYGNNVEYIWVDEHKYDDMPIYRVGRSNLSLEIYFRLLIPEYLPKEIDRVLMLDVDIVVNRDLSELYNIDFENKYFAAAPNMCHNFMIREDWRSWYPKNRENWIHYNTGVLMWNLKKIREDFPKEYIFKLAWQIPIKTPTFEEEIFNVAFGEKGIKSVAPEKWNYISTHDNWFDKPNFYVYKKLDNLREKCHIVHYAAMNPWQGGVKNESFKLWWFWSEKSPYYMTILKECYYESESYLLKMNERIDNQEKKLIYIDLLLCDKYADRLLGRLHEMYINRIMIYGAGRVAKCLNVVLKKTGIYIACYIDKNYRGEFCGKETIDFMSIKKYESQVDAIIVSTPYYYEEIVNDISELTSLNIISVDDLLKDEVL